LFTFFAEPFGPFLLEPTLVDDLRQLYHDFNGIYKTHVDDAKFDVVKGRKFKSLKERLITVCHLLKKHPEVDPGKSTELIQAVFSEDFQHAHQIFPKSDRNNKSGKTSSWWSTFSLRGLFSSPRETDEELLRVDSEVKEITSGTTDSSFLLQLEGVDQKDLEVAIQEAVDLACSQLSSSIDAAVKKMTHAVLRMQKDECKRLVKFEMETEERKVLGGKLSDFIQVINRVSKSDGRKTSWVLNSCRG
jgi:hypothetical protein